MAKTFVVNIYTPQSQFLSAEASSLVISGLDGEFCILAGHMPLLLALDCGYVKVKIDDEWRTAVASTGFLEFNSNCAEIFVDYCEWFNKPEEGKGLLQSLRERYSVIRSTHRHNEITLAEMPTNQKH